MATSASQLLLLMAAEAPAAPAGENALAYEGDAITFEGDALAYTEPE